MELADVIDLEARLAADEQADPEALRERERVIAATLPSPPDRYPPDRPQTLLRDWLDALRHRAGRRSLGQRVAQARSLLGLALAVIGFATGVGAASATLAYDGHHPVNAMTFLWVFVFAQLLLLSVLLLSLVLRRLLPGAARGVPGVGLLRAAVRQLGAWFVRVLDRGRRRAASERLDEGIDDALSVLRRVHRRGGFYRPVERWSLVAAMQAFAVAFNVGAIIRCLQLVAFTDIAFAWSSTLTIEPTTLHSVVKALAAPWASLLPSAAPTADLVALTRYVRLEGAYLAAGAGRTPDPLLVGGWWPFLVVATAFYGLLPRVVLWFTAHGLERRALRRVPLDTPDVQRVLRRLRYPRVDTREAVPPVQTAPPSKKEAGAAPAPPSPPAAPPETTDTCALVLWRDAPDAGEALRATVAAQLGWEVRQVLRAGGIDFDEERRTTEVVAAPEPRDAVLVLAESFEAPDKALLAFLRTVRSAVGPRRPVVVGLTGETVAGGPSAPSDRDVRLWREGLSRLADPYLDLEPLGRKAA